MYKTKYGLHNGDTWENLCQQVFKYKYGEDGYQEMVSSPGDYGIEGFTKKTGLAFQCYCPKKIYTQSELYEKQRDKITADLNKLSKYQNVLASRLGTTKISQWIFVTPDIIDNALLAHAEKKTREVLEKNLDILETNFVVLVKDADFFASEIMHIQTLNGEKLVFDDSSETLDIFDEESDLVDYQDNIKRKNKVRCVSNESTDGRKLEKLNELTIRKWFDGEAVLKRIERDAPKIYYDLARVINQYEDEVSEMSLSWSGDANNLVDRVKSNLYERIKDEIPSISATDQRKIADNMVSKWIALCPLDFE